MARAPAATFWPTEARTALPAAADLPAFLDRVAFQVPARIIDRAKQHREGFGIIRALLWLGASHPSLFPATLIRQEAPDFIVEPKGGALPWAIEHTDAGDEEFQRWLARTDDEKGAIAMPSPNDKVWLGDAPERAFDEEILHAVRRKSEPKRWKHAPHHAVRIILAYDRTQSGILVSDAHALDSVDRAAATAPGFGVMLVRNGGQVLVAGVEP